MKILTNFFFTLYMFNSFEVVLPEKELVHKVVHPVSKKPIGLMIYGSILQIRCWCNDTACGKTILRTPKEVDLPADGNQPNSLTVDNKFPLGKYKCLFDKEEVSYNFPYRLCSPDELKQFCGMEKKCKADEDHVPYCVVTTEGGPLPSCEIVNCDDKPNMYMYAFKSFQIYATKSGRGTCNTLREAKYILSEGTEDFNDRYNFYYGKIGREDIKPYLWNWSSPRTFGMFYADGEFPGELNDALSRGRYLTNIKEKASGYLPLNSPIHVRLEQPVNVYFETSVTPDRNLHIDEELVTENYMAYKLTYLLQDGSAKSKSYDGNVKTLFQEVQFKDLFQSSVVGGSFVSMYSLEMEYEHDSPPQYQAIVYGSFVVTDARLSLTNPASSDCKTCHIICKFSGQHSSEFTVRFEWTKDGAVINDKQFTQESEESTLTINKPGKYVCTGIVEYKSCAPPYGRIEFRSEASKTKDIPAECIKADCDEYMPKIPPPVADEPTSYLIWVVPLAICLLLFLIFIVVVAVVIIRRRLALARERKLDASMSAASQRNRSTQRPESMSAANQSNRSTLRPSHHRKSKMHSRPQRKPEHKTHHRRR